jgi:CRP-like cAMP-binding protein
MCFGHEELFQGLTRKCRVKALSTCLLMYVNEDNFKDLYVHLDSLKVGMIQMDI